MFDTDFISIRVSISFSSINLSLSISIISFNFLATSGKVLNSTSWERIKG